MRFPFSTAGGEGEAADLLPSLARSVWWLRAAVFVVVVAIVLTAKGSKVAAAVELGLGAIGLLGWWASDREVAPLDQPTPVPRWALLASLSLLTGVGAVAATSHHDTSLLALTIMSTLAAGAEADDIGLTVVVLIGVLGVEVGAVIYQDTDLGTMLGYPALIASLALLGRYRRAYRFQAEQAQALLAESRRAQEETERAAALTERTRIAREIHDVLAHSLGALGIQLQVAEAILSERGDIDSAIVALHRAQRLVEEGMTETRRAVRALRVDGPPLPQAVAALIEGQQAELTVSGEPFALHPAAGLALLRVAQESVTNVTKYGDGRPAQVTLSYTQHGVALTVENELPGDPQRPSDPADAAGGYGLAGMHERLRLINGELSAGPLDGRWVVRASLSRESSERRAENEAVE